jgi:hypothetical protein
LESQQSPWFELQIFLLEMVKEGAMCEVLQVQSVIRHDVGFPWEEVCQVAVSVLAFMGAGVVAKVGCRPVAGDCALGDAGHSRGVVRSIG